MYDAMSMCLTPFGQQPQWAPRRSNVVNTHSSEACSFFFPSFAMDHLRLHVERSILGLPSGDIPSLVVEVYLRVKGVPFGIDNAAHRLQSPTGEMPFLSGIPKDEEETEEVNDGKSGACRASERKIIACGWRECVEFIELQGQKEERSAGGEDPVDESKPLQEFLIRFCEQELGFSLVCLSFFSMKIPILRLITVHLISSHPVPSILILACSHLLLSFPCGIVAGTIDLSLVGE
eukprot:TRINITY_DN727_c0_g1_i1.p1 TRINITY_DN727_c0_g1~~TRINITY_DN727_c0_g1_i1.p1  ORF type:complete len:234 (+),score=58.73 TRINITY_DN727_c0_g1_i1:289-990(+)